MLNNKNQAVDYQYENFSGDIFDFFRASWKAIALCGLLGVLTSLMYLKAAPSQYEATAIVSMAQVPEYPSGKTSYIETPASLILRMGPIGTLDDELSISCGFDKVSNATLSSYNPIKLSIPKGVESSIAIQVRGSMPTLANECTKAIFNYISKSQDLMARPKLQTLDISMSQINEYLRQDKELLSKQRQSGVGLSGAFFNIILDIRELEEKKKNLQSIIFQGAKGAKLDLLVSATDIPVYPRKQPILALGLFFGLFVGLLLSVVRLLLVRRFALHSRRHPSDIRD